jgi:hypothetical protein
VLTVHIIFLWSWADGNEFRFSRILAELILSLYRRNYRPDHRRQNCLIILRKSRFCSSNPEASVTRVSPEASYLLGDSEPTLQRGETLKGRDRRPSLPEPEANPIPRDGKSSGVGTRVKIYHLWRPLG